MTRFPPDEASVVAAVRILEAHRRRPDRNLVEVELSAWLLGAIGEPIPILGDSVERAHAAVAAAAGGDDVDALIGALARHEVDGGDALVASACELAGPVWPDELVAFVEANPQRRFVGRMLATTSDPERLLRLVPASEQPRPNEVATVAELAIHGRDIEINVDPVGERWAAIVGQRPEHLSSYRDGVVRLLARDSLDDATEMAGDLAGAWGRDHVIDGASAVLARLVLVDPQRAVAMVARHPDPMQRACWMVGLAWWLDVVPEALPLFTEVLDAEDPEVALVLARILSGTPQLELLDRALSLAAGELEGTRIAMMIAPGPFQLRAGGHFDVADAVARTCRDALSRRPPEPGDEVSALDLFEVVSGPGPDMVPWGAGPGLP